MRILHVEDNEDTRTLVSFVLQAEGWEAVSVDNPVSALTHAASGGFDLYLIDNWLDGDTGNNLCADLRSLDQHTPILFYSGAMLDVERVRATGAQGYLEKPCSPEALVKEILKLTGNRSPLPVGDHLHQSTSRRN
ncbi:MAG TPA: response regulator [Pyrinomonadaceae bacterium]|nr:response regulator [Pyrinomonadaceae bacterium]